MNANAPLRPNFVRVGRDVLNLDRVTHLALLSSGHGGELVQVWFAGQAAGEDPAVAFTGEEARAVRLYFLQESVAPRIGRGAEETDR